MNKKQNIITISIALILFIILTIIVSINKIPSFDTQIQSFFLNIRNDNLTKIITFITNIGSASSLITLSLLILINIKNKKYPISIIINLISVFLISQLAKIIITRPRPIEINLIEASGYSYPSGHTMVSMAYFGFLAYLASIHIKNKILKNITITILITIPTLIGLSRIYLGVHYPSDVLAGILLSIIYLTIFINLYNKKGA